MYEFIDYVMGFYGVAGIYPMGVTEGDIIDALRIHIERLQSNEESSFVGDSIDREAVREILIEQFGYKWVEG